MRHNNSACFFLLTAVLMTALFFAAPARAGILEFFFPMLATSDEPDPSQTLQAPFADTPAGPVQPGAVAPVDLPVNAVPIEKPHRSATAVGGWIAETLPLVLTAVGEDYKVELEKTAPFFDKPGWDAYMAFMQEKGMLDVLQSGKYNMRSFVENAPIKLNEGVLDGRYRWLFEVPVIVSFLDKGVASYKDADPISQRVIVTLQVGRSSDAANKDGILIERWSGKVGKLDKK